MFHDHQQRLFGVLLRHHGPARSTPALVQWPIPWRSGVLLRLLFRRRQQWVLFHVGLTTLSWGSPPGTITPLRWAVRVATVSCQGELVVGDLEPHESRWPEFSSGTIRHPYRHTSCHRIMTNIDGQFVRRPEHRRTVDCGPSGGGVRSPLTFTACDVTRPSHRRPCGRKRPCWSPNL